MRKFSFMLMTAWAALSLSVACEKNEEVCPPAGKSAETSIVLPEGLTPKIGYREAFEIARRGIDLLKSSSSTRAAGGRVLDPANVKYVVTPATRSGSSPDTLMYVFNFADSAGFALVATARESEQLLAVTEKGTYTPGEPTDNPGFDLYMKCAENYLRTFKAVGPGGGGLNPPGPSEYMYKLDSHDDVESAGPFVTVKWGQREPYNGFCPRINGKSSPAGCVATAIAQIMTYYAHPASISLTYGGADVSVQILNWDAIRKHVKTYTCTYDCTEHLPIARLCREIGQQVKMSYGPDSSTAYDKETPGCFSHFGYTSSSLIAYDYDKAINSLGNKKLVYARGNDGGDGHAWVIDGYKIIYRTIKIWKSLHSDGPWLLDSQETRTYRYTHCNWGWDGDNNGYFNEGSFKTAHPDEFDPGSTNNVDYNFTISLNMVKDIAPR